MNTQKTFRDLWRLLDVDSNYGLANRLDWDVSHISRMYSGQRRISASFLFRVCYVKSITPQHLFYELGLKPDDIWNDKYE